MCIFKTFGPTLWEWVLYVDEQPVIVLGGDENINPRARVEAKLRRFLVLVGSAGAVTLWVSFVTFVIVTFILRDFRFVSIDIICIVMVLRRVAGLRGLDAAVADGGLCTVVRCC